WDPRRPSRWEVGSFSRWARPASAISCGPTTSVGSAGRPSRPRCAAACSAPPPSARRWWWCRARTGWWPSASTVERGPASAWRGGTPPFRPAPRSSPTGRSGPWTAQGVTSSPWTSRREPSGRESTSGGPTTSPRLAAEAASSTWWPGDGSWPWPSEPRCGRGQEPWWTGLGGARQAERMPATPPTASTMPDDLLALARAAKGFMPDDEGLALFETGVRAAASGLGPLLEVGAYCGKSSIYLGAAARRGATILFSLDHHHGSKENQAGWEHHDPTLVDQASGRMDTLPVWRRTVEEAALEQEVVAVV